MTEYAKTKTLIFSYIDTIQIISVHYRSLEKLYLSEVSLEQTFQLQIWLLPVKTETKLRYYSHETLFTEILQPWNIIYWDTTATKHCLWRYYSRETLFIEILQPWNIVYWDTTAVKHCLLRYYSLKHCLLVTISFSFKIALSLYN